MFIRGTSKLKAYRMAYKKLEKGEGFSGTTIKDTWTKPRRRVEAGEGGGFGWVGRKCRQV